MGLCRLGTGAAATGPRKHVRDILRLASWGLETRTAAGQHVNFPGCSGGEITSSRSDLPLASRFDGLGRGRPMKRCTESSRMIMNFRWGWGGGGVSAASSPNRASKTSAGLVDQCGGGALASQEERGPPCHVFGSRVQDEQTSALTRKRSLGRP
jgi:hypothetical protein